MGHYDDKGRLFKTAEIMHGEVALGVRVMHEQCSYMAEVPLII